MNKNLHKAISVLLILALLLPVGIAAAERPALATAHPFSDVPDGRWYSDAVQFVYEHDIMGGVGNNRFDPQGHLTRAAVTALLFRVHNERPATAGDFRTHPFTDVPNNWTAPYVAWAHQNGIISGTSATTFNPNGNITRQEFATMVYRYAMEMTRFRDVYMASTQWTQFTDRARIATFARNALRWMNMHGIVQGATTTTINPRGTATRAEAAVMMMRFVERLANSLICPGCGDEQFIWEPSFEQDFEDNSAILVLTRCATRADNRDWIPADFCNIDGILYVRNLMHLSGRWYSYIRRVWDAERDALALDTPEAWQAFEEAAREAGDAYPMTNWRQFRRIMLIRLDQNCKENVARVIQQLQQHEFIRSAAPNHIAAPANH